MNDKLQQALNHLEQAVALSQDQSFVKKFKRALWCGADNPKFAALCFGSLFVATFGLFFISVTTNFPLHPFISMFAAFGLLGCLMVVSAWHGPVRKKAKANFLFNSQKNLNECNTTLGGILEPALRTTQARVMAKMKTIHDAPVSQFVQLLSRTDIPNGWWLAVEEICDEHLKQQELSLQNEDLAQLQLDDILLEDDMEIATTPIQQHMKV